MLTERGQMAGLLIRRLTTASRSRVSNLAYVRYSLGETISTYAVRSEVSGLALGYPAYGLEAW